MSRYKQLLSDSVIYGVGAIFAKGIGFLLLPIYTRVFTPAEYGTIEMLVVVNGFLSAFLMMGMDSAQSFFFFEQKKKGVEAQSVLISSILQWRLTFGSGIVIISMLLSPLINSWFFNGQLDWVHFAIAFSGALFTQVMMQSADVYRLLYKPIGFIIITLGNSLVSAAVAITLVVWLEQGILGFFIGMVVGASISAILGWYRIRKYLNFSKFHSAWWPRLLKFGIPLLPASLAMYVMSSADRWFIVSYHGETSLGLYAIGAKFAILLGFVIETFRKAWWPIAMDSMQSDDGPMVFRFVSRFYMGLMAAGAVILTMLSPLIIEWFTAPAYHDAYPIVGILAWQSVFYGFFLIGSAGLWKAEKTAVSAITMVLAAVINIVLDYYLVPDYGLYGAAYATILSFFLWNVIAIYISEKFWRVGLNYIVLFTQSIVGLIATTCLVLSYENLMDRSIALGLSAVIVIFLLLSVGSKSQILNILTQRKNKKA